jgi:hypothetical protein
MGEHYGELASLGPAVLPAPKPMVLASLCLDAQRRNGRSEPNGERMSNGHPMSRLDELLPRN